MIVTHIDGRSEMLTDYKSLQRKRRVNGEYSLSFLLFKTDKNEHSFPLAIEESIIEYDNQQYRIKKMTEKTIGNTPVKQVQADHTFFDLVDEYQYETISGYKSLPVCLMHALERTNFTFDVVDFFSTVQFENFGNDNALSLIQTALNRFNAEININGKHLTFKRKNGRITDIQFRYKHNIKTIEKFVDSSNLSTYIRGFGKLDENGNPTVVAEYTSPLASYYGIRHAPPVRDERYTTHSGLLERITNDLQDKPDISITLSIAELKKAGINTEQIELGDEIFTIYEPLDIDINARIMELLEFPEEPTSNQVTLANFRSNITDEIADFGKTKDKVDGIFNGSEKLPFNVLDEAVKRATLALQSAQTELIFENGLIAVDPTDPNRLVWLNSKGVGISKNGGKTFDEAITADGFVLSAGAIGQLSANNVDVTGMIRAINNEGATTIDGGKITTTSIDVKQLIAGLLVGFTVSTQENPNLPRVLLQKDKIQVQNQANSIAIETSFGASGIPAIRLNNGSGSDSTIYQMPNGDLVLSNFGGNVNLAAFSGDVVMSQKTSMWDAECKGSFNVLGPKNASVLTNVGMVNISAYETAEYYFGDIGRGEVINGKCVIEIESLFKETVNTNIDYEVFLASYGKGLIYVDEMTSDNFTVKGDDIKFAYEIKAKRKNYEDTRLEFTYESEVDEFV